MLSVSLSHVNWSQNELADKLTNRGLFPCQFTLIIAFLKAVCRVFPLLLYSIFFPFLNKYNYQKKNKLKRNRL